jgi:DNA primase
VTLVFDGDDAGRRATLRALGGLLPLPIELDVVRLPGGADPCDLLIREGASGLTGLIENASEWLDFGIGGLQGLSGAALSEGVDELLGLVGRLPKPVHRESCMRTIADRLELTADAVRQQAQTLGRRRADPREEARSPRPEFPSAGEPGEERGDPVSPRDRDRERGAYLQLAGAVLLDNSLVPAVSEYFSGCPDEDVKAILEIVLELYDDEDASDEPIDSGRVINALGDHPARDLVIPIEERARAGESTRQVAEGAVDCLERLAAKRSIGERRLDHSRAADDEARSKALLDIWNEHRRVKVPADHGAQR